MIGFKSFGHFYNNFGTKKVAKLQNQSYVLVKICYKLLNVIQEVENSFDKATS